MSIAGVPGIALLALSDFDSDSAIAVTWASRRSERYFDDSENPFIKSSDLSAWISDSALPFLANCERNFESAALSTALRDGMAITFPRSFSFTRAL